MEATMEELKYDAAEKILNHLEASNNFEKTIDFILGQFGLDQHNFTDEAELIKSFYKKYINLEVLREDYLRVYTEVFTLEQLQGLDDFYETNSGQALLKESFKLMSKVAEATSRIIEENASELQKSLEVLERTKILEQVEFNGKAN